MWGGSTTGGELDAWLGFAYECEPLFNELAAGAPGPTTSPSGGKAGPVVLVVGAVLLAMLRILAVKSAIATALDEAVCSGTGQRETGGKVEADMMEGGSAAAL